MKQTYVLERLNCANCAEKIRIRVERIASVESVDMNFVSKKLTLNFSDGHDELLDEHLLDEIKKIVKEIEPDVNIIEDNSINEEDKEDEFHAFEIAKMVLSGILLAVSLFAPMGEMVRLVIEIVAFALVGYPIVFKALKNMVKGNVFDENFLMSIASIGAFAIGEHGEAVGVMLFYTVGEFCNDLAVDKSRRSIAKLMDLRPDYVNIMKNGEIVKVLPSKVKSGDTIIVKTGERIAIDGIVVRGSSSLDTVAMTGESVPRDVGVGDTVISGCINLQGVLEIQTTTDFSQSTVAKVLELTENAQSKKARVESFITRFAKVYTPIVVISALLLAVVPTFVVGNPGDWIHRALTFLVVSCPCALVLSVPLSYFNGIGGASGKGVLVKGGAALDMLAKCDTLVFDKTGTLTKGNLAVSRVIPKGISEEKLLEYASYAEAYSSHPIAKGIINAYNKEIDLTRVSCLEIAGKGIKAEYEGKEILCGNKDLLLENGIAAEYETEITAVFLAVDGKYVGVIELEDELKEGIAEFISDARRLGIKKTVMLTGDKRAIGEKIGRAIGIDEVRAELLPDEKVNELEKLMADGCRAAYTGDGINDAPVLARVDIGIAMGGMGTDAAIEAADVVIMNDDVTKILTAIKISKRTQRIVVQNIVFSLAVKFSVLGLSAFGLTTMWWAVFADAGVSLIAIVNSLRSRMNKV